MHLKSSGQIVRVSTRESLLKRRLRRHLANLGFSRAQNGDLTAPGVTKEVIRRLHAPQRREILKGQKEFIARKLPKLQDYFASGGDVSVGRIEPRIERVASGTWQADLFRLASLTWSVPVSSGFGRRLRYLVWDDSNGKLIGIFAIGDPVFNLSARDNHIGWGGADRVNRLVNIMDAYVLGAVPPYNMVLGGKLVACLVRSRDVYEEFAAVYGNSRGIISNELKKPKLLAVTTSSSMGRSSVYNRLKLAGVPYFQSLGYSGGWGHFHVPDNLFVDLREYLRDMGHPYADTHEYGDGPNWRIRMIRAALSELGFKGDVLRHGIQREVFISYLADNAVTLLQTGKGRPQLETLRSVAEIGNLALDRWMIRRAETRQEFSEWSVEMLPQLIKASYSQG
ncbi:Druantia anti-phage system protein DruA [Burkholderia pseudomallei]|uniref:Druantia anti-phage system protein DruA n=1 Tax=Burkholderia pseudomallei TaxID=28450 RepID=UPI00016B2677|nr:Druantia anti-phage system protein DruA [Burkholderia pseudomallei]